MKRRSALALAAAFAVGLAGCGIPDETEVRTVGGGPAPGFATGGGVGLEPPKRESATTEPEFVTNYLTAAAGEPDKAYSRVREYLAPAVRDNLKDRVGEAVTIHVVHVLDTDIVSMGAGISKVTLKVEQVGVLNAFGQVGPATQKTDVYTFTIGEMENTNGLFIIKDPPDVALLSGDMLDVYYEERTLYFWSADERVLVPDARYIPRAIPLSGQPTEILDMLIKGPSPWLADAVDPLPPGTDRTENVPDSADRLEIGLNAEAAQGNGDQAQVNVEKLGRQLLWSLRPYVRTNLELKIEGQANRTFAVDQSYRDANPANGLSGTPERFAIYEGKIYRLAGSPNGGVDPLPRLLLGEGVNQGIVAAGLARETTRQGDLTAAALVVQQRERFRLRVGSGYGDTGGSFVNGPKTYAQMGRPVWLKAPLDTGLVVADGRLYRFSLGNAGLTEVSLEGIAGPISAVGVAPDGRRIAVVANDKAYVATVTREDGGVDVQTVQEVRAGLAKVTGVDWSAETTLVVAGPDTKESKIAVWQASLDGAIVEVQQDDPNPITYLVAYPRNPTSTDSGATQIMYAGDRASYDLLGADGKIEANEMIGAPPDAPKGSAIAPFFLMN